MPIKITFMEKVKGWIEVFSSKSSTCTYSSSPKKKFSDVVEYVRQGKIGKSLAGSVRTDADSGFLFTYEYHFGKTTSNFYQVKIQHRGEIIDNITITMRDSGAVLTVKEALNKIEKTLPDYTE